MVISNIWGIYRNYLLIYDLVSHSDPRFTGLLKWTLMILFIIPFIQIIALILIWLWQKIGIYIYTLCILINVIILIYMGFSIFGWFLFLTGNIIFFIFINGEWYKFR